MTMDRHLEIAGKLDTYVLRQLAEPEAREVEAHLQVCDVCAAEVRELNAALEAIAVSVPPGTPSSALRERVLGAVAQIPQDPRVAQVSEKGAPRRSWMPFVPLAAAAVLLLVVGIVAFRIDQSRRELLERVARYATQTDLALSILTAGDMREIPLAGRDGAASTAARAYVSPTRGLLVVADRLPAPPPGRAYQVWVIEGTTPVSAGMLGEEPGGRGMLIVTPPKAGMGPSVTVAVTDEPPGGRPAPSGTIRLAGSI